MKYAIVTVFLLAVAGFGGPAHGQQATITQTFDLQPGWNAIYLEVQPTENRVEDVFAGLPVVSVWRYIPDAPGADFIADPAEGLAQVDGWFGFFPATSGAGFLTNLFTLRANQAYLVRMEGTTTRTLSVSGTPVLNKRRWAADSYTLTGFEVEATMPPTFAEYFVGSPAHSGADIYRLDPSGQWLSASLNAPIASGAAYWVWTDGASTYQGPLVLSLDQAGVLDFTRNLSDLTLTFSSKLDVDTDIVIRRAVSGDFMPLVFEIEDPDTEETAWPRLPDTAIVPVGSGSSNLLSLGVRRADFTALHMEEILEISNGFGVRKRLRVLADTFQPVIPPTAKSDGAAKTDSHAKATMDSYAGLWIGNARVNKVSESQLAGTEPQTASGEFALRLLLHVDANGAVRMLKEVTRMWEEGTLMPDPENSGFNVVDKPGRYVLLTKDELFASYKGAALRDGEIVGVRFSTVSIEFEGTELEMQGSLAPDSFVSATILIDSDNPTNPFYHRYHPDHDNKDAQFLPGAIEAQAITREITVEFASSDGDTNPKPDFLSGAMVGVFSETITGLHRNPIFVSGPIQLTRISAVSVLNQ